MVVKLVGITEQEGLNSVRKHPITKMGTIQNLYSRLGNNVGMFNRKMVGRRPKNPLIDDVERFKKLFKE